MLVECGNACSFRQYLHWGCAVVGEVQQLRKAGFAERLRSEIESGSRGLNKAESAARDGHEKLRIARVQVQGGAVTS